MEIFQRQTFGGGAEEVCFYYRDLIEISILNVQGKDYHMIDHVTVVKLDIHKNFRQHATLFIHNTHLFVLCVYIIIFMLILQFIGLLM